MRERLQQWEHYREWADAQDDRDGRPFDVILRDLDFLYRQFSPETRATDPDPEKLGIQRMRRVFELYDRRTRRA